MGQHNDDSNRPVPDCPPVLTTSHGNQDRAEGPIRVGVANHSESANARLVGIARLAASSPPAETRRKSPGKPEYFVLPVKSILNQCDSDRVPFDWTINPYRGCEFACKYCYARYTHEYMELDGAEFEKKTYEWKLTYRGGRTKCDIMLTAPHVSDIAGKMIPYTTAQKAKTFQFDRAVVESAYREFYRQVDAQQSPIGGGTLAFPGAEGYGAYAKGGRGGKVLFVTNLSDSGPGSLREAIETKGPRTVIFRVGGLIETKGLVVREPYLTIAGQAAPGDGICIKKNESDGIALELSKTHDVVIRFLRLRAGNNTGQFRSESFRASDSDNFIVDHCSCSWGNPHTLTTGGSLDRFTVQWCIIGEGNNRQRHAFAGGVGGDRSAWHHNLFAHMEGRVPRWGDITVQCDFRNNVLYDWGSYCGGGDLRTLNYVNNYLRAGPSSIQRYFIFNPKVALPASVYVNGNFMVGRPEVGRDNWKGVLAERSLQSSKPFPAPPVQTQSAAEAFELVLRNAGATRPRRDSVDARIVSNVRNGTGKIINDEKEVGGWPAYASGEPPVDTARDGIPDEWKKAHGLPLNDPNVANAVSADGYTMLEVYLNSLVVP